MTLLITAFGLILVSLTPNPYLRLFSLRIAAFGTFAVLPVFCAMPTAFLSGAAAAAGVAYINSIGNIAGFTSNHMMRWLRDLTGSHDIGLLAIAAICNAAAFATLSLHHEKEMEPPPILDDTAGSRQCRGPHLTARCPPPHLQPAGYCTSPSRHSMSWTSSPPPLSSL